MLWLRIFVGIGSLCWVVKCRNLLYRVGFFYLVVSRVRLVGWLVNIVSIFLFLLLSVNFIVWYCMDWKLDELFSVLWNCVYLVGVRVVSIDYCCVIIFWMCLMWVMCLSVFCRLLWVSSFCVEDSLCSSCLSYSFVVWCWMMNSILLWCFGLFIGCCVVSSWFSVRYELYVICFDRLVMMLDLRVCLFLLCMC